MDKAVLPVTTVIPKGKASAVSSLVVAKVVVDVSFADAGCHMGAPDAEFCHECQPPAAESEFSAKQFADDFCV